MKIYPYNKGSKSVKALKESLNIKSLKQEGKPIKVNTLLNWGASNVQRHIQATTILNHPACVAVASNKLKTFEALKQGKVLTPMFTTSKDDAKAFLKLGSKKVVCRTILNGHSGDGIIIATKEDELVDAPLYVSYINKEKEFRVHVFDGEVLFVQEKKRKLEVPDDKVNWQVRNLKGGFIFANQNVELSNQALNEAIRAVNALGLDFGAVDMVWHKASGYFYVLEVNTAPGLQGTTLEKYVEKLKEYV